MTGPKWSGKSHSWYLISHVRDALHLTAIRINPSEWDGVPKAIDVASSIADRLGWDPPRADLTNVEANAVHTLTNWFKGKATKQKGIWWLIFDGLNEPNIGEGARDMVRSIACAAASEEAGGLRVVLLAFDGSLPPESEPSTLREALQPVPPNEIQRFLQAVAEETNCAIEPHQLDRIVQSLLGDPPHEPVVELNELGRRLGDIARSFRKWGMAHA